MAGLSPAELLAVWERGSAQTPADRALTLLLAGGAAEEPAALSWTVGERDAALLALREETFGRRLVGVTACPGCGEKVEIDFEVDDIRVEPPARDAAPLAPRSNGRVLRFRPPTCGDLAAIAGEGGLESTRDALLERCIVDRVSVEALPDETVAELVAGIVRADPQADVELALRCPSCAREWRSPFDIVSFLWREVEARALALVRDVHALASAYGWSEAEILALSAARRAAYLELADA